MPVYKRKEKTKDGKQWYYRTYYTDIYGNRKQKCSKKYMTKGEAKEAEAEFLLKLDQVNINDNQITFEQVYKEWLLFKKGQVKSSTHYSLTKKLDKNILNELKDLKLSAITVSTLFQWKLNLEKKEYSINHTNAIINYMKEILNYAVINHNFDAKIANRLQRNKNEKVVEEHKDVIENFWTYDEFNIFISKVDEEEYYTLFNFLYYTGLRISEATALNWKDIDFKRKIVRINKTLTVNVEGADYLITSPKTSNSVRLVDLTDNIVNLLKAHYKYAQTLYKFSDEYFVFGDIRPLPQTTIRRKLKSYIELSKCKKITLHGFRHSHVSLLINIGLDIRQVADRIGDTREVVESTYYHMFPEKKIEAVDKLNKFIIESEENKC